MPTPTKPVDALLDQLRQTLKEELRAEVRAELIAELAGGKAAKPTPAKPSPVKTPKKTPGPKPKAAAASSAPALSVKAGQRRSADDIGEAAAAIMAHLRKNPGSRIDQVAAALGASVKDLQLPIQFLLKNKKVKKAGKLRGTSYTAKG